jgi:hypothetical protein
MRRLASGATVFALLLAASVRPVAAQAYDAEFCEAARDQVAYLNANYWVQETGMAHGIDLMAQNQKLVEVLCDPSIPYTPPVVALPDPPAEPTPAGPTPVVAPTPTPPEDDGNPTTRRDACVLLTVAEVGAAMKQGVVANEADPAGMPFAQGCEFDGVGDAHTDVMYFQANSAFFFESFHTTAEANGVQNISDLGDRAFSFVGGDGPGVVVAVGDKLFALEFSGMGSGPAEKTRLLTLAHQAAARVH